MLEFKRCTSTMQLRGLHAGRGSLVTSLLPNSMCSTTCAWMPSRSCGTQERTHNFSGEDYIGYLKAVVVSTNTADKLEVRVLRRALLKAVALKF